MIRSALYAPGNVPRMLEKVGTFGADAVVLDLEDAVPVGEKKLARGLVREALERIALEDSNRPMRFVRVNAAATGLLEEDLSSVFCPHLDGIYLPKVESAEELLHAGDIISELENRAGRRAGSVEIHPIIESAKGVMRAYPILENAPSRVQKAGFGAGDLMRDIGLGFDSRMWDTEGLKLLYVRSHLVLACRAADKLPPVDSVYGDISNMDGLENEAKLAKKLGFQGKSAIHPGQVEIINRIFTPTSEEIEYSRRIIDAFEEAEARGSASFTVNGAFVDIAVAKMARSVIDRFVEI
jgi:citrate lyase subunit beta/citryl-CoA lyase